MRDQPIHKQFEMKHGIPVYVSTLTADVDSPFQASVELTTPGYYRIEADEGGRFYLGSDSPEPFPDGSTPNPAFVTLSVTETSYEFLWSPDRKTLTVGPTIPGDATAYRIYRKA